MAKQLTQQTVREQPTCRECGASLKPFETQEKLCAPCKVHNMTIAILKYPIGGAGEE
jgi:protein-arginine kinase activator protein McsA